MPHETNDQKSKLFLFDLLSKKQRIRSNLTRTVTGCDLFNSIFKNENKKLFLDNKILTRLEAINSTIIISGYLKGKTCFTEEKVKQIFYHFLQFLKLHNCLEKLFHIT